MDNIPNRDGLVYRETIVGYGHDADGLERDLSSSGVLYSDTKEFVPSACLGPPFIYWRTAGERMVEFDLYDLSEGYSDVVRNTGTLLAVLRANGYSITTVENGILAEKFPGRSEG